MPEPETARELFAWHSFDLRSRLPDGWQSDILQVATSLAIERELTPTSVTSREADTASPIPVSSVGGVVIAEQLPWLDDLYRNGFRQLARSLSAEPVATARDQRYGINLNVQTGEHEKGYECHTDSNPIEALLYVTSHPEGSGGELVVANNPEAANRDQVDADATRIYPVAGHLIMFDARRHAHYVAPLADRLALRVVAAMNYYTPSCSEAERPPDLDQHLFGSS